MKTFAGRCAASLLFCLVSLFPLAAQAAVTASVVAGNLQVGVSGAAETATITVNGANVEVRDSAATLIIATPSAGVTDITVTGTNAADQAVTLNGTLTLSGAATVSGVDIITHNANWTAASFSYKARRYMATFGAITATTGDITLEANLAAAGVGNFYGLTLQGTQVTAGNGKISLKGRGGSTGPQNHGVVIFLGAKVRATGLAAPELGIIGDGGAGTGIAAGILISDAGTEVSSASGLIGLVGNGGTAAVQRGVQLQGGASVSTPSGIGVLATSNTSYGVVLASGASMVAGADIQLQADGPAGLLVQAPSFVTATTALAVRTDQLNITGPFSGGTVQFFPTSPSYPVVIGPGGPVVATAFYDPANFATITATQLVVGQSGNLGSVQVASSFSNAPGWNDFQIIGSGLVSGPGVITVPNLTITDTSLVPKTWNITGTQVQQGAGTPVGFSGSMITVAGANVVPGDTFNVTPHPTTAITVHGNLPAPPTFPGDRLSLNLAGVTGTNLTAVSSPSGYSGTVTFTNRATVTFTGIESAPANRFTVTAPAGAAVGAPFNVTVTALDALNQVDTAYTGTVHFTSTDPSATLPADVMLVNGTGTFPVTMFTIGSRTVTATDTVAASITGTSGPIAVVAGAATHFSVTAPAAAAVGGSFSFTVTALDASNNVATGYAGTVHFTSSDGSATLPADATLVNGTGNFNATLNANGSFTITATDTVVPAITGTSGAIVASLKTFSAPSATGTGIVTATFTGGGAGCSFTGAQMIGSPPGAPPVPPNVPQPGATFPHGMFDFSLTGCTVGSSVQMTITYPSRPGPLWKYGSEVGNPANHWYVMPATYAGNSVTYTLTDGGQGDDDLVANGTMVDPVGPLLPAGANVPTMSEWMLMLLAMLMLGVGMRKGRLSPPRRRGTNLLE